VRRVTLFDTCLLDAQVGVYRRGPVIDWETQQQIGTARTIWYATSFAFGASGFWLRDADGRVVV
jgi:hypothetical protein